MTPKNETPWVYLLADYQSIFSDRCRHAFAEGHMPLTRLRLLKRNGPAVDVIAKGILLSENTCEKKPLLLTVMETDGLYETDKEKGPDSRSLEFINAIIHEINQPLAIISNHIHGCIRRFSSKSYDVSDIIRVLTLSSVQLNRASDLILNFKNIFLESDLQKQEIGLDDMISHVIEIAKTEFDEMRTEIEYRKFTRISVIQANEVHIQNIILNLVRNSAEAIRDHGIKDGKIKIEVDSHVNGMIEIQVRDNGPGFNAKMIHRIFDPCFTTKPYGIGTGLALCKKWVEAHGGLLTVDSAPAFGASLKFTLPVT